MSVSNCAGTKTASIVFQFLDSSACTREDLVGTSKVTEEALALLMQEFLTKYGLDFRIRVEEALALLMEKFLIKYGLVFRIRGTMVPPTCLPGMVCRAYS